jgi:hypothetical protein
MLDDDLVLPTVSNIGDGVTWFSLGGVVEICWSYEEFSTVLVLFYVLKLKILRGFQSSL